MSQSLGSCGVTHLTSSSGYKISSLHFERLCIIEHLSSHSELNYYVPTSLTLFPLQIPAPALHPLAFRVAPVKALFVVWWWQIYGALEVVRVHAV